MSDHDDYTDLDYWLQTHQWVWKAVGWIVGVAWGGAIVMGIIWQLTR